MGVDGYLGMTRVTDLEMLGRFVRYEREQKEMTVCALCKMANVNEATYWRLQSGKGVQAVTLLSIMESLGHDFVSFGKSYESFCAKYDKWRSNGIGV